MEIEELEQTNACDNDDEHDIQEVEHDIQEVWFLYTIIDFNYDLDLYCRPVEVIVI